MYIHLNIADINWLSVLVVTILSFVLGSLWHSKLFGKAWKEDAKPVFDASKKINYVRLFGMSAILHFLATTGLDLVIGVEGNWFSGLHAGLFISVFWIVPTFGVTYAFVGRTIRLMLIDSLFYVVYFSIAGMILGAW